MSKLKVLHTSDWHLGKRLFKAERYDEHEFFLNWLITYIKSESIDVLIVAGDIFDVPSPPTKSLKQFYNFVYQLGAIKDFQTIIISGNHDSKDLLKAPGLFFEDHNCFIYTDLDILEAKHTFTKKGEKVNFRCLPYFRNFELTNQMTLTQSPTVEEYFKSFFKTEDGETNILISHHGFGKYSASGSEQAIYLSGLDYFPLEWVKHYDYVALGHIHKKQTLNSAPPIIYPGSPIPLRFSEKNEKFVSLVEIDNKNITQNYIEIPSNIRLTQLKVNQENFLQDVNKLKKIATELNQEHYLELIVELDSPRAGIADTVREVLKDSPVELLSFQLQVTNSESEKDNVNISQIRELDISSLFQKYYKSKFPETPISEELLYNFKKLLEESNENS